MGRVSACRWRVVTRVEAVCGRVVSCEDVCRVRVCMCDGA